MGNLRVELEPGGGLLSDDGEQFGNAELLEAIKGFAESVVVKVLSFDPRPDELVGRFRS